MKEEDVAELAQMVGESLGNMAMITAIICSRGLTSRQMEIAEKIRHEAIAAMNVARDECCEKRPDDYETMELYMLHGLRVCLKYLEAETLPG